MIATEWNPNPSPVEAELFELLALSAMVEGRLAAIVTRIINRLNEDRVESVWRDPHRSTP